MKRHSPFSPLPLEGAVERSEAGLDACLLKIRFLRVVIPRKEHLCAASFYFRASLSVCKEDFSASLEMTIRMKRLPPLFFLFLSDTIKKIDFSLVVKGDRL